MRVRYIGSCGDGVVIGVTNQVVEPKGEVDVTDELGLSLCDQPDNWLPADTASASLFAAHVASIAAATAPADPPAEPSKASRRATAPSTEDGAA